MQVVQLATIVVVTYISAKIMKSILMPPPKNAKRAQQRLVQMLGKQAANLYLDECATSVSA